MNYFELVMEMTLSDAMRVFNISSVPDEKSLKDIYKKLAIQNHPDRGGNVEMMKKVNVAYDLLKKNQSATIAKNKYEFDRDEINKSIFKANTIVKNLMLQKLQLNNFTKYFESIFDKKFSVENYSITDLKEDEKWPNQYIKIKATFSDDEKETVLFMYVSADTSFARDKVLLPGDESLINVNVATEILHNRRKIKLVNDNFSFKTQSNVLNNPEIAFPKQKLLKQITKKASTPKKISKKDFITTLKLGLGASTDGDTIRMKFDAAPNTNQVLIILRSTFMGRGYWTFQGIYNIKLLKYFESQAIYETPKSLDMLIEALKKAKKAKDIDDSARIIEGFIKEYKKYTSTPEFDAEFNEKTPAQKARGRMF